jgi:hypothetical protein
MCYSQACSRAAPVSAVYISYLQTVLGLNRLDHTGGYSSL